MPSSATPREGSGPPVLMIQGVGVAGCGWRPQAAALAHAFRVVTFDNRGIGGSTRGSAPLSIDLMADDALAIADAAGLDRFHLVGHSMGGLIAQAAALRARPRIQSLTLMCTFADGREGSRMSPAMMLRAMRTRLGTRTMRRRAMMDLIMPPGFITAANQASWGERLGAVFGRDLADPAPIAMQQLKAMSRYDATAGLADARRCADARRERRARSHRPRPARPRAGVSDPGRALRRIRRRRARATDSVRGRSQRIPDATSPSELYGIDLATKTRRSRRSPDHQIIRSPDHQITGSCSLHSDFVSFVSSWPAFACRYKKYRSRLRPASHVARAARTLSCSDTSATATSHHDS